MQNSVLILIGAGSLVAGLVLIIILALRTKKRPTKAPKPDILTGEERQALKDKAAAQYEATLVRELKHFESQLGQLSSSLLEELRQDVKGSDHAVVLASQQLTAQLSKEYTDLANQATNQLKLHITTAEHTLAAQTATLQENLTAIVEARKQAVIKRVDTELADILSQYLNATLEQLDLTEQEQFVLSKLEEIKPKLKEDLARVQ